MRIVNLNIFEDETGEIEYHISFEGKSNGNSAAVEYYLEQLHLLAEINIADLVKLIEQKVS